MTQKDKKTVITKEKKILGPSKYSNSKKKRQKSAQEPKEVKDVFLQEKNRSLKVKIKNLQKEIKRIQTSENKTDLKNIKDLEKKLEALIKVNKNNFKRIEANKELSSKADKETPIE